MKKAVGVTVIGIGVAAILFNEHRRRNDEESVATLRREVAAMSKKTDVSPRFIVMPPTAPESERQRDSEQPRAPAVPPREPTAGESQPTKSPQVEMAETHAAYERVFANDHIDPQWAARAKQLADAKLPALLPEGSSVRSFECRATICRMETAHKDRASYWQFLRSTFVNPKKPLWDGGVYVAPLNDDPEESVMVTYLSREGEPLPPVAD